MPDIYIALTHYPVLDKNNNTIASAVTNLDLHDIARASKTFGVKGFYVITPLEDQKKLVERIVLHWIKGYGAAYNPKRREALETIRIKDSIELVVEDIFLRHNCTPKKVVTCAKKHDKSVDYKSFRKILYNQVPYLLIFGTAWGLSEQIIQQSDYILEPIKGNTSYNHLSVRSAVSIILDRLLGEQ